MFAPGPPPPPPPNIGSTIQVSILPKMSLRKIGKIRFWDAIFNTPFLLPITREQLIEGIEGGNVIGLNEPDIVVSTGEGRGRDGFSACTVGFT